MAKDEKKKSKAIPLVGAGLAAGGLLWAAQRASAAPPEEEPTPLPPIEDELEALNRIVNILYEISQDTSTLLHQIRLQLDSIIEALSSIGEVGEVYEKEVLPTFISPDDLNDAIQSAARTGDTLFPYYQVVTLVPVGQSVTITLNVPQNFVDTRKRPLVIVSDNYSQDVTIDVYVDNDKQRVTASSIPLTDETTIDFGQYYIKRNNVKLIFTNNSDVDTLITCKVQPALLQSTIYEDWYKPILDYGMKKLNAISAKMGGLKL